MTGEKALSFVDTNVRVYAFHKNSSPKKRVAQRLLNELMKEDRLRLSTQVFAGAVRNSVIPVYRALDPHGRTQGNGLYRV